MLSWRFNVKYLVLLILIITVFCTAPLRNYLEPENIIHSDTLELKNAKFIGKDSTVLKNLSIDQWVGNEVIVLEKPQIFRQNGYELFFCIELDSCIEKSDSTTNHKNGRIRYEVLSGRVLKISNVEPLGNEWLITFENDSIKKKIFGKTHKLVIKEIGFISDLENARKRWIGKTVFSKKGVISTIKEDRSGFGSLKVGHRDSLMVIDVKWGYTPLPVDPIWLMVQTPVGNRGFIPLRFSWTNTASDRIRKFNPWKEFIMETDPAETYSWDENTWEIIDNHRIVIEMTTEQVLMSWGEPLKRTNKEYQGVKTECWIYGSHELYFKENRMIAFLEIGNNMIQKDL